MFNNFAPRLVKSCTRLQKYPFSWIQKKLLTVTNAFLTSQFSYWPLTWIFHSREIDSRINKIHEKAFRRAYKYRVTTFEHVLTKNKPVTTHERNLQLHMTEMLKIISHLNADSVTEVSKGNLRIGAETVLPAVRTTTHVIETTRIIGTKIWQILPATLRKHL